MALPRLTSNQLSVLYDCAEGVPRGRALAAIPSLVKRGLVVVEHTPPKPPPKGRGYLPGTPGRTRHRLTPVGLEVYEHHRKKRYEAGKVKLDGDYRNDLVRARNRTLTPEEGS